MLTRPSTGFPTVEDARARLEQLMVSIYLCAAFRVYPDTQESLRTEFLVAVYVSGKSALLLVESTLVTRIEEARVIGSGFMQQMATELGQKCLTVEQASIAALYLIYETKRRNGYVGGVTHICKLYADGRFDLERTWDQSARESLFESLRQWNYRMVVTVGSTSIQPWDYKEIIESFTRNMRSIRGEFGRTEQRYQRWMAEQATKLVIKPKKLSKAPKSVQEVFKNMSSKPSGVQKSEPEQ